MQPVPGKDASSERDEASALPPSARPKRKFFVEDAIDLDGGDRDERAARPANVPVVPSEDLVAAARRAAQAAAARAERRAASAAKERAEDASAGTVLPERRTRSVLMVIAILLLLLSAGLLYSWPKLKPEMDFVPPATEQLIPPASESDAPPAAEAAPPPVTAPDAATPPSAEAPATPAPDVSAPLAVPDTTPEAGPSPDAAEPQPERQQMAPHSTIPSADFGGTEVAPSMRVSGAPAEFVFTSEPIAHGPDKALVTRVQALLNKLGYYAGNLDGEAGSQTRDAIKIFELRAGMEETGEVTAELLAKLERLAG